MDKKQYIKFCFVSYGEKFYTNVVKHTKITESYANAKKNIIRRALAKFGKYNFTDVSYKIDGHWSKIGWPI